MSGGDKIRAKNGPYLHVRQGPEQEVKLELVQRGLRRPQDAWPLTSRDVVASWVDAVERLGYRTTAHYGEGASDLEAMPVLRRSREF